MFGVRIWTGFPLINQRKWSIAKRMSRICVACSVLARFSNDNKALRKSFHLVAWELTVQTELVFFIRVNDNTDCNASLSVRKCIIVVQLCGGTDQKPEHVRVDTRMNSYIGRFLQYYLNLSFGCAADYKTVRLGALNREYCIILYKFWFCATPITDSLSISASTLRIDNRKTDRKSKSADKNVEHTGDELSKGVKHPAQHHQIIKVFQFKSKPLVYLFGSCSFIYISVIITIPCALSPKCA